MTGAAFDVIVHAVQPVLPDAPVVLRPTRHLAKCGRVQRAGSVLSTLTAYDQSGSLEHLDVLGDGRKCQVERPGKFVHGRLAICESGQDRASGRIGEGCEGLAEPILVNRSGHVISYFP